MSQNVFFLCCPDGSQVCNLGQLLQDVEALALLLGALVHDFKHRGRSNAFLIKTNANLALVYNDISVLENYHLSEVRSGPVLIVLASSSQEIVYHYQAFGAL